MVLLFLEGGELIIKSEKIAQQNQSQFVVLEKPKITTTGDSNFGCGFYNPSIMSRKEFSEFYKSIIPYIFKNGINTTSTFLAGCSLNNENIIIVSPDGSLYRCPSMVDNKPFSICNVFSKELSLNKVISSTSLNSNCKKCKFSFLCNGGCKYNNIVYHNTDSVNTGCYYSEIENDLYNYYAAKYSQYLI